METSILDTKILFTQISFSTLENSKFYKGCVILSQVLKIWTLASQVNFGSPGENFDSRTYNFIPKIRESNARLKAPGV